MSFSAGGETYYDRTEALRFIDECERRGVRILGMDFMLVDQAGHTPMNSTNWNDLEAGSPEETWREARKLLENGIPDGGNYVIFVTDE